MTLPALAGASLERRNVACATRSPASSKYRKAPRRSAVGTHRAAPQTLASRLATAAPETALGDCLGSARCFHSGAWAVRSLWTTKPSAQWRKLTRASQCPSPGAGAPGGAATQSVDCTAAVLFPRVSASSFFSSRVIFICNNDKPRKTYRIASGENPSLSGFDTDAMGESGRDKDTSFCD